MERIEIPGGATYSPVALTDLMVGAPLASRVLLGATLPGQMASTALFALYQDLTIRFDELEAEQDRGATLVAVVLPNIRANPTDGPVELRAKADLLQRHAVMFDSLIVTIGLEVEDLEKRSRRDRVTRGFLAGIDRFGDTNLPVAAARGGNEESSEGDDTVQPISVRLEGLRLLVDRYETQRSEALSRAQALRRLAAEITE